MLSCTSVMWLSVHCLLHTHAPAPVDSFVAACVLLLLFVDNKQLCDVAVGVAHDAAAAAELVAVRAGDVERLCHAADKVDLARTRHSGKENARCGSKRARRQLHLCSFCVLLQKKKENLRRSVTLSFLPSFYFFTFSFLSSFWRSILSAVFFSSLLSHTQHLRHHTTALIQNNSFAHGQAQPQPQNKLSYAI